MKIKTINPDNLNNSEINDFVTRVKVFLINNQKEILLANCNDCFMLPGGHVEDNEDFSSTLKREILEETGIEIEDHEIRTPLLTVEKFIKNNRNSGKNRLSSVVYFLIKSNKKPDPTKINLTDFERENNFKIKFYSKSEFESILTHTINNSKNETSRVIAEETLNAFKELEEDLSL